MVKIENNLDDNYLYEASPEDFGVRRMPYHCKNWVFKLIKDEATDKYYMRDTYWNYDPDTIEVTPDNINFFKPIFDMREVVEMDLDDDEKFMYDDDDLFYVRDQNQFNRRVSLYRRKEAKKNVYKEIETKEQILRDKKRECKSIIDEIKILEKEIKHKKSKIGNEKSV
ncbi:hypothetical protein K4V26_05665 [Staphylococcus epidermidis]|nr:hypothetical protein [Staphylococcus epidermidis]